VSVDKARKFGADQQSDEPEIPMTDEPASPNRRIFISRTLQVGAASMVAGPGLTATAEPVAFSREQARHSVSRSASGRLVSLPEAPSLVLIQHESGAYLTTERAGRRYVSGDAEVWFDDRSDGTVIHVACPNAPLSRVIVRWKTRFPEDTLLLGDAWERSYGDLQWRFLEPERVMPWYFAAHHGATGRSFMMGVKTQPSAMCFWTVDGEGISLWLDFRNGGSPSLLGERQIVGATLISSYSQEGETPFSSLRRFCRALCSNPRLPASPVCGSNSWYYTYGKNFDAQTMRRDAALLAELADSHRNRPFCVIDGGWTPGGAGPGGPWTEGDPKTFPDMPGLAADMKKLGVRPGIWIRPTALSIVDNPRRLRPGPIDDQQKPLDPTLPENIDSIHADIARVRSWGYELIKHDFSTYDLLGRWGNHMGAEITDSGWHFHDQTLTNAEIVLNLYRTLREAAADAVLLGCNTIGHLGAGLFETQRAGDDVSSCAWERTRRMGINALSYRLAQNGTFFVCDPDCAAHTERTQWKLDSQFLDLIARSGTALFISADPTKIGPEQKHAFRRAMQTALSGGDVEGCEPLDWLYNTTPEIWRFGTQQITYKWSEELGANPFPV
jgi:alpha-galactosidase